MVGEERSTCLSMRSLPLPPSLPPSLPPFLSLSLFVSSLSPFLSFLRALSLSPSLLICARMHVGAHACLCTCVRVIG
jgi:hypothetical protein